MFNKHCRTKSPAGQDAFESCLIEETKRGARELGRALAWCESREEDGDNFVDGLVIGARSAITRMRLYGFCQKLEEQTAHQNASSRLDGDAGVDLADVAIVGEKPRNIIVRGLQKRSQYGSQFWIAWRLSQDSDDKRVVRADAGSERLAKEIQRLVKRVLCRFQIPRRL